MSTNKTVNAIAQALEYTLSSPNVADLNMEPANVVDMLDKISLAIVRHAKAVEKLADAIGNQNE